MPQRASLILADTSNDSGNDFMLRMRDMPRIHR